MPGPYLPHISRIRRFDLQAVIEMVDALDGRRTESAAQREWHSRMTAAALQFKETEDIRKWIYPEEGFLGGGRVAHFFAEKHLGKPQRSEVMARNA